jgi:hypothetical protein
MCREKFPAFYGTGWSIAMFTNLATIPCSDEPDECNRKSDTVRITLRNVLKHVTTFEISKKRGSSEMLHNVTHSSSVLHFEAKNRKPKTLELKKKVTPLQCTVYL